MEPQDEQRKLTTILSADVVGYSRLMGEDEAGTLAALKTHRKELIEPKSAPDKGRLVKLMGDGASGLRILVSIIVPVALPILMAVAMLSFIYSSNEFLFGLILTTRDAVPVTVEATFFVTSYGEKWGQTAAAMVLGVLPPLILGIFAYPYIGKSMLSGAVKG